MRMIVVFGIAVVALCTAVMIGVVAATEISVGSVVVGACVGAVSTAGAAVGAARIAARAARGISILAGAGSLSVVVRGGSGRVLRIFLRYWPLNHIFILPCWLD